MRRGRPADAGGRFTRRDALGIGAFGAVSTVLGLGLWRYDNPDPHVPPGHGGLADPTDDPVEAVFCAGWDTARRVPVHPMSEALARSRDAAGEQYAVVLFVDGRARMAVEVCWKARHAELWNIDGGGRKYRGATYRRWPDGRLRLLEVRSWKPGHHGEEPSFRGRVRRSADGAIEDVETSTRHAKGTLVTRVGWDRWPEDARPPDAVPAPSPAGWARFAGMVGRVTVRPGASTAPARFPWRAPQPMPPRHLTELTTPGTRFITERGAKATVQRVPVGRLKLPSGRLVVQDPTWFHDGPEVLLATVPPGEYPVDLFRFSGEEVAYACRVTVTSKPVRSWQLALREGEHELFLGDGEFYGAGVDSGTIAIGDASGWPHYKERDLERGSSMAGVKSPVHILDDPRPGAPTNVIVMPTYRGDGDCPVWLGRSADGGIACYLVDFLPDARPAPGRAGVPAAGAP